MGTLIEKFQFILTEVQTNNNKHWIIELYDNDDIRTTWGRVGYDTQSKVFPSAGRNFMEKKIREKEKKGYTKVRTVDGSSGNTTTVASNGDLHNIAKTQLLKSANPTLENLIKRFVDANIHKITANTQITYNSTTGLFATPLGVVTLDGLTEARELLAQIAPFVRTSNYGTKLSQLVSLYLRIIPQNVGMRLKVENLLPDENAIQKQNDLIDSLESSYQSLSTVKPVKTKDNKVETVFQVDLDVLNDVKERQRLITFFDKSKKSMHHYDNIKVREVFKVTIRDMDKLFSRTKVPIQEVFHGTSQANCLSILKSGLKVSPPSTAVIAGKMMGLGIYGAINSSKSLGYTFGRWGQGRSGDSGWMFICEFAMGKIYETKTGCTLPHGYDSVWAKAGYNLFNDELVVYQNNQVNVKYLLECK